jgi:hypothetical protein
MRLILAALLLVSCTDVRPIAETSVFYKRDVKISFEGQEYLGFAVLPKRDKYDLALTFAGQLDLFTFRSCHREITQEDAGGGRIFGKKNQVAFTYRPGDIETGKPCPVILEGYEVDKGRHSWAYIDFETPLETLGAVTLCNGTRKAVAGVSGCQSLSGLLQRVIFPEKVVGYGTDGCPGLITTNGEVFDLIAGNGICEYMFRTSSQPTKFHRFTTLGYTEIMVRKQL